MVLFQLGICLIYYYNNRLYNLIDKINLFEQTNHIFGYIDYDLIFYESHNWIFLLYYHPMIERMVRIILDEAGEFNIEFLERETFKTLNSMLDNNNEKKLKKIFGRDLINYLYEVFKANGNRNKILHYDEKTIIYKKDIDLARKNFIKLIKIYFYKVINKKKIPSFFILKMYFLKKILR